MLYAALFVSQVSCAFHVISRVQTDYNFFWNQITSAAGFPPTDTHSNSISRSSVVTRKSPCRIFGGSGGTSTVSDANRERIPGCPVEMVKNESRNFRIFQTSANGCDRERKRHKFWLPFWKIWFCFRSYAAFILTYSEESSYLEGLGQLDTDISHRRPALLDKYLMRNLPLRRYRPSNIAQSRLNFDVFPSRNHPLSIVVSPVC